MAHAFAVDSDARERAASTRGPTSDGATGSRPSTSLDAPSPATSRPDTSSAGSSKGWSMSSAIGSMGRRLAQLGQTGDKALNAEADGRLGMAVNKAAGPEWATRDRHCRRWEPHPSPATATGAYGDGSEAGQTHRRRAQRAGEIPPKQGRSSTRGPRSRSPQEAGVR